MFSLQQNWRTESRTGSAQKGWGMGEEAQMMYTHVSKCKNDKIKKENNVTMKVGIWISL
jgi:hypothetical protein